MFSGSYSLPPESMDVAVYQSIAPLVTLMTGGPAAFMNATGISDPAHYALDVMNTATGTGGGRIRGASAGALRVKDSTVEIDGGLSITNVNGGGLNVQGTTNVGVLNAGATSVTTLASSGLATLNSLAVTTSATVGTTLGVTGTITGSSTVQGTRLISTVVTGTAPLTVASTTMVTNLNAEFIGGQNLAGLDALYVNAAGDTMTGVLTMEASTPTARILKVKYGAASGGFWLGATNSADPALQLSDDSGNIMALVNPSGSTYALDVNSGTPATNAARFTGDVLITTDLGVRTVNATTNLNASANVTGAKLVAGGTTFVGSEKLRVISGTSVLEGSVDITTGSLTVAGGISAGASSAITGGLTVVSGGIAVTSGDVSSGAGTMPAAGAYRLANNTAVRSRGTTGDINLIGINSSDVLNVGQTTAIDRTDIGGANGVRLVVGGNNKIRCNAGGIGFNGAAEWARTTYTVTNPATDRALNVTADTVAQVAAVLGTLIADLQTRGDIG